MEYCRCKNKQAAYGTLLANTRVNSDIDKISEQLKAESCFYCIEKKNTKIMIIDHTKIAGQKYRTDQGDEVALNRSQKGMK